MGKHTEIIRMDELVLNNDGFIDILAGMQGANEVLGLQAAAKDGLILMREFCMI